MNRFAFYHMHKNIYFGECLCIVYTPTIEEIKSDALQSPYILMLIKSKNDLSRVRTINNFQSNIFPPNSNILLRISSECLLGAFGDTHCDCESQRVTSLREINIAGQGIYIHIPQEGQGNSLFYKNQELELQVNGVDPSGKYVGEKNIQEASEYLLGEKNRLDKRNYKSLAHIFKTLKLNRYKYDLIGNNYEKATYFSKSIGIKINSVHNVKRVITIENAGEYLAKLYMKDFEITDQELQNIYYVLFSVKELPTRVVSLLKYIKEDIAYGKQFRANEKLLRKIVALCQSKQKVLDVQDLTLLKDSTSYTEYQTEIAINKRGIDLLFKNQILINDESLAYEENYFYDLIYFRGVPTRSLKIRKSFRLMNREHPINLKLIYKVPLSGKNYVIKSISIASEEIVDLISLALKDFEIHFLPVFTHNITPANVNITVLLKRYSDKLRTLSLMGKENEVKKFIQLMRRYVKVEEIDDPTNHRYIKQNLSLGFQWNKLSAEELKIFKKYHKG
ncbi:MAG: hypothetical protein AB1465_06980 [Patescibacteria group bacterium]